MLIGSLTSEGFSPSHQIAVGIKDYGVGSLENLNFL